MRKTTVDLDNILSLISCARDYGFENDVLFDAFSGMMDRKLLNKEIESFSRQYLEDEGQEDYDAVKEKLQEFKAKYCKN